MRSSTSETIRHTNLKDATGVRRTPTFLFLSETIWDGLTWSTAWHTNARRIWWGTERSENMTRCRKSKSTEDVRRKDQKFFFEDEIFFFLRKEKHERAIQKTKGEENEEKLPTDTFPNQDQSGHKTYYHILVWNAICIWKQTKSGQCNECILLLHWVHAGLQKKGFLLALFQSNLPCH